MNLTYINFPSLSAPASDFHPELVRLDARFASPLSGTVQDLLRPGAHFAAAMSWKVMEYADSQLLSAWAVQMAKAGVRSFIVDPAYKMRGSGAGAPAVNGAGQTGTALITNGWTASQSNVLMAGDLFQVCTGTITFTTAPANTDPVTFTDCNGNSHQIGVGNGIVVTFNLPPWFAPNAPVYVNGVLTTAYTTAGIQHQTCRVVANVSSDSGGNATIEFEPALRFSPTSGVVLNLNLIGFYMYFAKPSSSASYTPPRIAAMSLSMVEDILA
ncbi:MAG: hypothetical protein KGL39_40890 [Patescibacteria group bacterium]|nr:hypothetical protein [Patescibacteria group bacterium]